MKPKRHGNSNELLCYMSEYKDHPRIYSCAFEVNATFESFSLSLHIVKCHHQFNCASCYTTEAIVID